jgi:hypothetical protein
MMHDRRHCEGVFAGRQPNPQDVHAHKLSEGNHHVGVVSNETSIEIHENQERLYVLNLPRGRPVLDDLDLCVIHLEAVRAYNES